MGSGIPPVERQGDDARWDAGIADLDIDNGTRLRVVRRDVCHRDRDAEGRRLRPTRHDPRSSVTRPDRVAVTGDPAALDDQPDELSFRPLAGDLFERGPTDEIAGLGQLDNAPK